MSKNILIVGGAGFIGSHLIKHLLNKGYNNLFVIDDFSTGILENIPNEVKYWNCDISDAIYFKSIKSIFSEKEFDTVFFLAAKKRVQNSFNNPVEYHDTNVTGLLHLLELSKEHGVDKFIYSSSSSVYGDAIGIVKESDTPNPISPYGVQKYIGEIYCKMYRDMYNLKTYSLRYFNVFGDNKIGYKPTYSSVIEIFAEYKKQNKRLPIYNTGAQIRTYTDVCDIVSANILIMETETELDKYIFNVCSDRPYNVLEIAKVFKCPYEFIGDYKEPFLSYGDNKLIKSIGWKISGEDVLDYIRRKYN